MYIYLEGKKRYIDPEKVELIHIDSSDIIRLEQVKDGVTIHLRSGGTKFIEGAKTDGVSLEW